MHLKTEDLEFTARLRKRIVAYDALCLLDDGRFGLPDGSVRKVEGPERERLRGILFGPKVTGRLPADARTFLDYCTREWSAERAATGLLDIATRCGASDVHVEACGEHHQLRLRLAGEVLDFCALPADRGQRLIAAFKHLAGCLPYRRDVVQEGRVPRAGVTADVRASFVPTALGERAALRLFGRLLRLDELGLTAALRSGLEAVLERETGLVLVSGPSGAGKTTTLYAMLHHLATSRCSAHLSLEDPVEQRLRVAGVPVDQIELCPEHGLDGEAALKAALRQDIDVLAVGELRTPAEARLALEAAVTGRLVLAGIHAGSVEQALQRLTDLGGRTEVVSRASVAVLHQRLRTVDCVGHAGADCSACAGYGRVRRLSAELWPAGAGA